MPDWFIYSIGFVAQILFSGRLIYQWLKSEKEKKVVTPRLFWLISLTASFLLFVYGWMRSDFAIMLGQSITYFIYIRNLQIDGSWQKAPKILRWFLLAFPVMIIGYAYNNNTYDLQSLFSNSEISTFWLIWGSSGQILFTLRFVYQWLYSEKNRVSALPKGFWIISLIGSLSILAYAIYRRDPVLFAGHSLGIVLYTRNLFLAKNTK